MLSTGMPQILVFVVDINGLIHQGDDLLVFVVDVLVEVVVWSPVSWAYINSVLVIAIDPNGWAASASGLPVSPVDGVLLTRIADS